MTYIAGNACLYTSSTERRLYRHDGRIHHHIVQMFGDAVMPSRYRFALLHLTHRLWLLSSSQCAPC